MIEAVNAGKLYRLYDRPFHRLCESIGLARSWHREFWALRNLYLSVDQGACFGVIGRNGAGKSTLLKLISGVSRPSEGSVRVEGSVYSILELAAGFHSGFTGRENVFMNCALLGYSRVETERLLPHIVEFSELESFIDQPLRTYSTGMTLRLAFAVAATVDPDVLIIDEALAVGDERFRGKCLRRIRDYKDAGKTILLVSHDLSTVRHLCTHVALLDSGRLLAAGKPDEVLDQYLELVHKHHTEEKQAESRGEFGRPRWGSGQVQASTVRLKRGDGGETTFIDTGDAVCFELDYRVEKPAENIVFGFQIYRSDGTYINGSNHYWHENPEIFHFNRAGERGRVVCRIEDLPLLPGDYYVTVCCYIVRDGIPQAVDHWERAMEFTVSERTAGQHGLIALPTQWTLSRHSAGASWDD
ncbi:MAG: ATP-binding cassette domain-containing protein [bacterium]|nr:ATP-binding cassette domain-containing protein [bacterium]